MERGGIVMFSWTDMIIMLLSVLFIAVGIMARSLRKGMEAHSKKSVHSLVTLRHVFSGSSKSPGKK